MVSLNVGFKFATVTNTAGFQHYEIDVDATEYFGELRDATQKIEKTYSLAEAYRQGMDSRFRLYFDPDPALDAAMHDGATIRVTQIFDERSGVWTTVADGSLYIVARKADALTKGAMRVAYLRFVEQKTRRGS